MKILMLGWELPPHYVGGMGVVCYSLCKSLAKSGADIEFILPFEADYSDIDFMTVNPKRTQTLASSKVTYKDLNRVNATVYGKVDVSTEEALDLGILPLEEIHSVFMEKVRRSSLLGEYDVIHAHDWLTMRGAIMAKKITGLPLFVHIHATEFDRAGIAGTGRGNEMIHQIEYEGMMMADKVIAVSQWTKDMIVNKYHIPPAKIEVVHNSMDIHYEDAADDSTHQYLTKMKKLGYKVVVNCGRMTIQKGITQLLEAAKLVVDKDPKVLFLLAGGGDQIEELTALAAELRISKNVVITGWLSGKSKEWRDSFRIGDLFVMPSVSEPFGLAALEAIGYGVPALVSKQSGVSEVINNVLRVDFWDVEEMANQILSVVRYPSLKQELWKNSYDEFINHSWNKSAGKITEHYKELASSS